GRREHGLPVRQRAGRTGRHGRSARGPRGGDAVTLQRQPVLPVEDRVSKHMMNKMMRAVEMSDRAVAQYVADPAGFVDHWLTTSAGPDRPADDHVLTDQERKAFADRDYGELYRLGAHPYLLWHFTEAVYIH